MKYASSTLTLVYKLHCSLADRLILGHPHRGSMAGKLSTGMLQRLLC